MHLFKRDWDGLRRQSEMLIRGDWLNFTVSDRHDLIARFCQGYVLPPLAVRAPTAYRAQTNDDGYLFTNVERLLAPPAHRVKELGRLNRTGQPTLYLAGTPVTALGETRAKAGTVVSILACHIPPDTDMFQVAPVAMTRLQGSGRLGPVSSLRAAGALGAPGFRASLEERGCLEQWLLQDQTLGELLVSNFATGEDQQALYEMTNAVREHVYATWDGYDGVEYPSIVSKLSAPNIALNAKRWGDIVPCEVWVVHSGFAYDVYPSQMMTSARPLLAIGSIGTSGEIIYRKTIKTFLEAAHDFKQTYGFLGSSKPWMVPMLSKPWVRHRISYGAAPDPRSFDFLPP